ncbi:ADP-heptose:LPS heptosyltransferase [Nitrosospira multiformis]|uniref:ADP-heptose:LPS heptosyltransferase n=1 Tax=Nitrosospira multiformis TaxID=1231 RepID=A0A2T5I8D3_9PROT|nr:glycosyltransferase family 9 protein [Nitrosospira multiformis]PTQ80068.1 ADP-heptose:LPS heptosyltransferase [Nitrosospira multiformis]
MAAGNFPPALPFSPRKIAVLHAKAVGDFIVILPALNAIKRTYPDAELILLAKPWVKEFLAGRPSIVDRVLGIPLLAGVNDPVESKGQVLDTDSCAYPLEVDRFCQAMQGEKLDVVIHMQGDGKSVNPFINKFGASLTAGMCNPPAESLDRSIPYVHYQSEILRNLEVAALIGAHTTSTGFEPRIEVTESDEQKAEPVRQLIKGKPYVVIHPGADDLRRVWPAASFAGIANYLTEKGYEVVVTGTPKEEERVANVLEAMNYAAIPCTDLGLGGLSALLQQSVLVVSNDTGPLHLARAVGARTVGIYWAPNVLNWGPLSRDRHRIAISWQLECPQCGIRPVSPWPFQPQKADCSHPYSFVESVPVAEVLALAAELLPSH